MLFLPNARFSGSAQAFFRRPALSAASRDPLGPPWAGAYWRGRPSGRSRLLTLARPPLFEGADAAASGWEQSSRGGNNPNWSEQARFALQEQSRGPTSALVA